MAWIKCPPEVHLLKAWLQHTHPHRWQLWEVAGSTHLGIWNLMGYWKVLEVRPSQKKVVTGACH